MALLINCLLSSVSEERCRLKACTRLLQNSYDSIIDRPAAFIVRFSVFSFFSRVCVEKKEKMEF